MSDQNVTPRSFSSESIAAAAFAVRATLAAFQVFNLSTSELRAVAINALTAAQQADSRVDYFVDDSPR